MALLVAGVLFMVGLGFAAAARAKGAQPSPR
jgi:hypothetical protein